MNKYTNNVISKKVIAKKKDKVKAMHKKDRLPILKDPRLSMNIHFFLNTSRNFFNVCISLI